MGNRKNVILAFAITLGSVAGFWGIAKALHFRGILDWRIKATYPAAQVGPALKRMAYHDYGMSIETRNVDSNLQAFFWRVGLLRGNQLEMQPEAAEALERVLLCAARVSLSTDAPLKFLQVKMVDALSGATVSLWRFVPDIKDSMFTRLGEEEYVNRLVVEFDNEASDPHRDWKEVQWDTPMTMEKFLAKQIVLRVKRQSPVGLEVHEDLSEPQTLGVVLDNWSTIEKQGARQQEKVSELVEKTAKSVITGYRFKGFREFVLQDSSGMALRRGAL
jgi:hypothetical protein